MRREINYLKNVVRTLQSHLVESFSGGCHEKDPINYRIAFKPEPFCSCERGGSADACGDAMRGSRQPLSRDQVVQDLGECIAGERVNKANDSGGQNGDLNDNPCKVRHGDKYVGIINVGGFSFPVLCGPDTVVGVKGRSSTAAGVERGSERYAPGHVRRRDCWATGCDGKCETPGRARSEAIPEREGDK